MIPDFPRESSAFVGPMGRLAQVPIVRGGSVEETSSAGWAFRRTVSGRVRAQRLPRERRSWSVSLVDTPSAWMEEFISVQRGAFGATETNAWVTPAAQVTNVMTLDDSMVVHTNHAAYLSGGGATMPDGATVPGTATCTVADPGATACRMGSLAAIPPDGSPITVSAYLQSSTIAYIRVRFLDGGGRVMVPGGSTSVGQVNTIWTRHSVTITPPPGAVCAFVEAVGTYRYAGACITWTPDLRPYANGSGANQVVITEPRISADYWDYEGPFKKVSFSIEEVG